MCYIYRLSALLLHIHIIITEWISVSSSLKIRRRSIHFALFIYYLSQK